MVLEEMFDPKDHVLKDVLEHLPFDQFNNFTKAIYRNSAGEEIRFFITIEEETVEKKFEDKSYSTKEITFNYEIEPGFEIPNFTVVASLEYIPILEFKEVIKCNSGFSISIMNENILTIIPNQDYNNTILNDEFIWLNEEFTNVYSNILIDESDGTNARVFYQSPMGIIGFKDFTNKSWVLDRFE